MTASSRLLLACLLVLGLAACPDNTPIGDTDADVVESPDAKMPLDAAEEEPDTGPLPRRDAGEPDGSTVVTDDGGTTSPDAGPVCTDECAAGSRVCDGASSYRSCGQFDADPCLELSAPVACADGAACSGDTCVATCRDECAVGTTFCKDRATLQVCGNFDSDACREPGGDTACGAGKKCEAGACVASTAACSDECTTGSTVCAGDAVRTCGNTDDDACLDLSAPVACAAGQTCSAGACVPACSSTCPLAGAKDCLGDAVRTCGDGNGDGCLEWGAPAPCLGGQTCSAGACAASCVNECQTAGGLTCTADGSGVQQCGQFDSDSCLDLSSAVPCPSGEACRNGVCTATCADECQLGDRRCGADAKSLESCGNFDADPCLEFGGAVACAGGAACASGACATPCTDECSPSATVECVSGQDATHVCGQYDSDPCLDWSSASACASYETCQTGACVLGATPGKVVLNEIVYDPVGTDSAAGNNLFVELWGPAGLDLEGFALVGVNGANGNDYASIALDGQTVGSDGYFVVAHPSGAAALLAVADLTSDKVDFQNGPDSVQLRWHGRVVDALAYGAFAAGEFPKGEGAPAAAAPTNSGKSLTRNAAHADTDVNQADFAVAVASPRLASTACSNACSTSGATQCGGTNNEQLQTCGDGNGDGCLEWSAAADCPSGKFCQGGTCVTTCTNLCPTSGATQCGGVGNLQVQTCGDSNGDGCREWSSAADCPSGKTCQGGSCQSSCSNTCTTAGNTQCGGTGGAQLQTCGDFNSDGCLEWGTPANCPSGQTCLSGACALSCTSTCTPAGSTRCSGSLVQTCADGNLDGCLEWSVAANCPGTDTCVGTACTCADECASVGATKCDASGLVMTCYLPPSGTCLKWSTAAACPNSGTCKYGACCVNDCTTGQTQCSGQQIQSCGEFDGDGCLDWSAPANCAVGGQVCQGTKCQVPCSDACPAAGATSCTGTQIRTCGDGNGDGCLEWSTAANCPSGQSCSMDICQDANAPEVILISPQGTVQSTQGKVHRMVVDATPTAGRTIAEVDYYAAGTYQGKTTTPPHEYNYTVPAGTPTGSKIALQAKAIDNAGSTGSSAFAYLDVKNDFPVATFVATIVSAQVVAVDASAVTDTETSTANLEVCFDWDNDGTCDTTWSTTKTTSHDYGAGVSGDKTIGMKVRDAVGQTSTASRTVTFTTLQYIGGTTITSSGLWIGTVIITGDVTIAAGVTITVDAGTQILFVRNDTNPADGVGDYTLTVNGALVVNGTAAQPVIFSSQQTGKAKGDWDRIILSGSTASSIKYAIVEYADVGLDVRNGSTLDHVTVQSCRGNCVEINGGTGASLVDSLTQNCGGDGVNAFNSASGATLTRHTSKTNGKSGVCFWGNASGTATAGLFQANSGEGASVLQGATLNLSDSTIEDNAKTGLLFVSTGKGAVTHNVIRRSGQEGVGLLADAAGNPSPVVTYNNVYSNSATGSRKVTVVDTSATLKVSTTTLYSNVDSATYTAPAGTTIYRVNVSYDEYEYYGSGYVFGYLLDGAGATIQPFSVDASGWYYPPAGTTTLKVRIYNSGRGDTQTITAGQVEVLGSTGASDVSAVTNSGTVDMRFNYLGTFPNVLSRISMVRNTALNVQGFVGDLFDTSTWSTGPYKAGTINDESWTGTIYVTGDITIPAGKTVTVAAGATVNFVNHDQDGDGRGDFTLTANGRFSAQGTTGNEVFVTGYNMSTGDGFQSVVLAGSGTDASTWTDLVIQNGRNAVTIKGSSSLTRVAVHGGSGDGVTLSASTGAGLTDVTVDGTGGDGVKLDNADNATLTRVTSELNGGHGLSVLAGSTGVTVARPTLRTNGGSGLNVAGGSNPTVTDGTFRANSGSGVAVADSSPTLDYCIFNLNVGAGLSFRGTGSPSVQHSSIKFNQGSGVDVWTTAAGSPTPLVQYSNIYSNATNGSRMATVVDTSATLKVSTTTLYSNVDSAAYTAPAGQAIRRVYVSYDEYEYYGSGYVFGYLLDGAGNSIQPFSVDASGWYFVPAGTTAVKVRIYNSGRGDTQTITGTKVELEGNSTTDHYELASFTDSGQTNAKYNYWTATVGDVPSKIYESRVGSAVDYSGYTGIIYPDTSVGPRP